MTGEATVRSDRPIADLPTVESVRSVRSEAARSTGALTREHGPR